MKNFKDTLLITLSVCILTGIVILVALFANYMEDNFGLAWGIGVMILFTFSVCYFMVTSINK